MLLRSLLRCDTFAVTNPFVNKARPMIAKKAGAIVSEVPSMGSDWRYSPTLPELLYTAEQCRAIDAGIINSGTPGLVLMKRAARAAFQKIQRIYCSRDTEKRSIFVFCGKGNNAGDGYLLAQLATDAGYTVLTIELAEAATLTADARSAREHLVQAGGQVVGWRSFDIEQISQACIIVDAILGTGIVGVPRADYAQAILAINQQASMTQSCVVSLDIPSGLCSDTGASSGNEYGSTTIVADHTICFVALKQGLILGDARAYVGEITFDSLIGDCDAPIPTPSHLARCRVEKLAAGWPRSVALANKYTNDAVTVIGGDFGMGGAPLMSASAALRLGAGLVKLITRPENSAAAVTYQPELLVQGVDENLQSLETIIPRQTGIVCIGPGLGQARWARQLLEQVLEYAAENEILLVVDADALNLIASNSDIRQRFVNTGNTIITPHMGEARRLLQSVDASTPEGANALLSRSSSLEMARQLSSALNTRVVLKGPATVCVTSPQRAEYESAGAPVLDRCCLYGNSGLATAGTGDVLVGMLAAALLRYDDIDLAIEMAVTLQTVAADYHCRVSGRVGFTAISTVDAAVDLLCELDP